MPTPEEREVLALLAREWEFSGPPGIMDIGEIVSALNQAPTQTLAAIKALFQSGLVDMNALRTSAFLTPEGLAAAQSNRKITLAHHLTTQRSSMNLKWVYDNESVDWQALSDLYRIAPLGIKPAEGLKVVFSNSRFNCFVYDGHELVGAGRALADGGDCSYICDIAVHPDYQGRGVGKAIVQKLVAFSEGHRKIILYANVGKEGFYRKLGFYPMNTAMAIFADQQQAIEKGWISEA